MEKLYILIQESWNKELKIIEPKDGMENIEVFKDIGYKEFGYRSSVDVIILKVSKDKEELEKAKLELLKENVKERKEECNCKEKGYKGLCVWCNETQEIIKEIKKMEEKYGQSI